MALKQVNARSNRSGIATGANNLGFDPTAFLNDILNLSNAGGNTPSFGAPQTPSFAGGEGVPMFGDLPSSGNNSLGLNGLDGNALDLNINSSGMDLSGYGSIASGAAGLFTAGLGLADLKQSKKEFKFNKALTNRNLSNQANLTNASLEDRQKARIESGGASNYQSVADYMKKNGVNGGAI